MATAPFGPVLEAALKQDVQGGKLSLCKDFIVEPRFFCCMSGRDGAGDPVWDIGVTKAPVAVLIVSPTRACAGDVVNADYSHSWSPFGTINSWSVDWGDGQVSNGAWPGAGNVDHPLGGYALPGTYTITLTVTDLLGATGTAEQQVEIIDCTVDDLEAFAGCGGSGVWHTANGGLSWEERGGGVLEGVVVHDLKVHPFTLGTGVFELWAATAKGLYRSVDSAASWERIMLPDPDGGDDEPAAASIVCSTEEPDEVYVLAYKTVPSNRVWLYRTTDKGETWQSLGFATEGILYGALDQVRRHDNGWTGISGPKESIATTADETELWGVTDGGIDGNVQAWDGVSWTIVDEGWPCWRARDVLLRSNGTMVVSRYNGINSYTGHARTGSWDHGAGFSETLGENDSGQLFVSISTDGTIRRHVAGNTYVVEYAGPDLARKFASQGGIFWAAMGTTKLRLRVGGAWPEDTIACPEAINDLAVHDGELYAAGLKRIWRRTSTGWVAETNEIPGMLNLARIGWSGIDWYAISTTDGTYSISHYYGGVWHDETGSYVDWGIHPVHAFANMPAGSCHLSTPSIGRTHILSMSTNGQYIYVGLLDSSSHPIVFRVAYDLGSLAIIHEPGAGTWGGVVADPNLANRVWVFGDFGATSKVLYSDDWGDNWTDVTDGSWAANEVVRPILPSVYDSSDAIAILNTALDAWHTGDTGAVWTKTGDVAFACHCGERDWMEDRNLFIGRLAAGANHLQFSPNRGVSWLERSGGFQPDTPVTALQIVS